MKPERYGIFKIDTTRRPPLAEVRAWPENGTGSRFVCEALPADAERIIAAQETIERLRAQLDVARDALRDYYPDRDNPAKLIDRIERAWMATEVALAATPPRSAGSAGSSGRSGVLLRASWEYSDSARGILQAVRTTSRRSAGGHAGGG